MFLLAFRMGLRRIKYILILFWFSYLRAFSQEADEEQENLKLCYEYSHLLGYRVESLPNPLFFKTIYNWLGTPYKYSGDNESGIDCSGFVCRIYKHVFGIDLAGSSTDIFKQVKSRRKESFETGDLVFFRIRKKRVSHVGIYVGNNKFVHASVQSGVVISDLDEPYYKKYFYKGGSVRSSVAEKKKEK